MHAVIGSDDGAVKDAARARAQALAPVSLEDLSTEVIDGAVDHADAAAERIYATIAALQTLPFFGGEKLVWLKSASFLADDVLGRSNAVVEALESLAQVLQAGVPADVRFLLSAVGVDKRRSFYKTLGKVAQVEIQDGVDSTKGGWEEKAATLVAQGARAKKLRFDPDAEQLIILLTGGDERQIDNEMEKIDLYLGEERREVRPDDVRALVSHSREGVIFELGDAIHRRDLEHALELLAQLMQQKETAMGILLAAITPTIRNLLLMKDLQEHHRVGRAANPWKFGDVLAQLPPEATAHLPRKKDGGINAAGLGFAAQAVSRYSLAELRAGMLACLDANRTLVTLPLEPKIVLEQLLVRLLGQAESRDGLCGRSGQMDGIDRDPSGELIPLHGGYRKLKSFQVAQLAYDVTIRFCERYIDRRSRTHDQMVQAASRACRISRGSQAPARPELKLTNVARASLEELRLDYEDFLRQRGLPHGDEPIRDAQNSSRCDPPPPMTWRMGATNQTFALVHIVHSSTPSTAQSTSGAASLRIRQTSRVAEWRFCHSALTKLIIVLAPSGRGTTIASGFWKIVLGGTDAPCALWVRGALPFEGPEPGRV